MIEMYVMHFDPPILQRKVSIKICIEFGIFYLMNYTVEQEMKCVCVTSGSSTMITDVMPTKTELRMESHAIVQCTSTSSSSSTLTTT